MPENHVYRGILKEALHMSSLKVTNYFSFFKQVHKDVRTFNLFIYPFSVTKIPYMCLTLLLLTILYHRIAHLFLI